MEIVKQYTTDNPYFLTQHHLASYQQFITKGIPDVLKFHNPYHIFKNLEKVQVDGVQQERHRYQIELYFGGLEGDQIYISPPAIKDPDGDTVKPMYPNEARLRNYTYSFLLSCNVLARFTLFIAGNKIVEEKVFERVRLGKIPLMLHSPLCVLHDQPDNILREMGESPIERGGYFVIRGKEKVMVSQERMTDNNMYLSVRPDDDDYSHVVEVRSSEENSTQVSRSMTIRITRKDSHLMVFIPRLRQPVPIFIVFRALGLVSDRDIISRIYPDWDKIPSPLKFLLTQACYDSYPVSEPPQAIKMLKYLTKGKTLDHVHYHLRYDFLPHLGSDRDTKAYYLGMMTRQLLELYLGIREPTDRDSFHFKRVDLPGVLLTELFRDYYRKFLNSMRLAVDETYEYNKSSYQNEDFLNVINTNNIFKVFNPNIIENGLLSGFRGTWSTTKPIPENRVGVVQELQRLSFYGSLSHVRRIHLPLPSSAKIVAPRRLHASQWGVICPVETPDGGNVGKIKTMSIACHISSGSSRETVIQKLRFLGMNYVNTTNHHIDTRILVNGAYVGVTDDPERLVDRFRLYRRTGWIDRYVSIAWKITDRMISILTDTGRLMRPLLWCHDPETVAYYREDRGRKLLLKGWDALVVGDAPVLPETARKTKKSEIEDPFNFYQTGDSLKTQSSFETAVQKLENLLQQHTGVIEYIDVEEENTCMISFNHHPQKTEAANPDDSPLPKYTHVEIHPSLMLGVQALIIPFMEHNQFPRNLFSSGQTKQSIGMYALNYRHRFDLAGSVLCYPQQPLVNSSYVNMITKNKAPYGLNAIVAVACYSGYNQEDSIIFNRSSIDRGLFRHVYFRTYEAQETVATKYVEETFLLNPVKEGATKLSVGRNYDKLDDNGVIRIGSKVTEDDIIVGLGYREKNDKGEYVVRDCSIHPKKGTHGEVHQVFIDRNQQGTRMIKVVVREERVPEIGDKFSSRAAQKGTIGMILPEEDLPYTKLGVRPDMIVNPHCFPSRMTLGQFFEGIFGKAGMVGGFTADATPFTNPSQPGPEIGKILGSYGMESYGNEIMYNGLTGVQMETDIFMTPVYYMRLKQLVHDKNQSRATGPRNNLTQQPTSGRAHGGGLRIGEMERDAVLGHGAAGFLQESFMTRGDRYRFTVDESSGLLVPAKNKADPSTSHTAYGRYPTLEDPETADSEVVHSQGKEVETPHAFKLLLQELQTMSIAPRIKFNTD